MLGGGVLLAGRICFFVVVRVLGDGVGLGECTTGLVGVCCLVVCLGVVCCLGDGGFGLGVWAVVCCMGIGVGGVKTKGVLAGVGVNCGGGSRKESV